uniref:Uncharacterized protein n=1 Tax=Leersia perrieri TaxID=77586 RepID=A0A0D9XS31_9ORYZ
MSRRRLRIQMSRGGLAGDIAALEVGNGGGRRELEADAGGLQSPVAFCSGGRRFVDDVGATAAGAGGDCGERRMRCEIGGAAISSCEVA